MSKHGVRWNQFEHPATNLSLIRQDAESYPNGHVGVVGTRGVGNLCFLDIDAPNVIEQIETETGRKLPATYTVQSSPTKAPYKKHLYFKQTQYLLDRFPKRFSRKDFQNPSIDASGRPFGKELYALKGIKGDLVVAAGNTFMKDDVLETYIVYCDAPVLPIPDWLTDWLQKERSQNFSETAKFKIALRAEAEITSTSGTWRHEDGLIKTYVKRRVEHEISRWPTNNRKKVAPLIIALLKFECENFFQCGTTFWQDEANVARVRKRIRETPFNEKTGLYKPQIQYTESIKSGGSLVLINHSVPKPRQVIANALKGLHTPASREQIHRRGTEALTKAGVQIPVAATYRSWVSRACKDAKLTFKGGVWVRTTKL